MTICFKKAEHPEYHSPRCPACEAEKPILTEETRKFSVSDPGDGLREEMGDIKWRLNLLRIYDDRVTAILKAARKRLPLHLHVMASISPWIMKRSWETPPKKEVRFKVEIDCREAESWDDLNGIFEALDDLGYGVERWKSSDEANHGYRQYVWSTEDDVFKILIKLYPKEVDEVDDQGVPVVKCKKVLLGKKFHRGYDHTEDVYAFDCGQGEDTLREEARKAGRL